MFLYPGKVVALVPLPVAGDGDRQAVRHDVERRWKRRIVLKEVGGGQLIRRYLSRSRVVDAYEVLAGYFRRLAIEQVEVDEISIHIGRHSIPPRGFAAITYDDRTVRPLDDDVEQAVGRKIETA